MLVRWLRGQPFNLAIAVPDLFIEEVNVSQQARQQKTMMVINSPNQRLFQIFPFFAQLPSGEFR